MYKHNIRLKTLTLELIVIHIKVYLARVDFRHLEHYIHIISHFRLKCQWLNDQWQK